MSLMFLGKTEDQAFPGNAARFLQLKAAKVLDELESIRFSVVANVARPSEGGLLSRRAGKLVASWSKKTEQPSLAWHTVRCGERMRVRALGTSLPTLR